MCSLFYQSVVNCVTFFYCLFALVLVAQLSFFFFFSSRRRHTRLQGDWSSDVCSSDLSGARHRPEGCAGLPRPRPARMLSSTVVSSRLTRHRSLTMRWGSSDEGPPHKGGRSTGRKQTVAQSADWPGGVAAGAFGSYV